MGQKTVRFRTKRSEDHKGMRREKTKPKIGANRHIGENPAKMLSEISPGKKGGEFSLAFGGQLTIPVGMFTHKKDLVTCCMVSPNERYKHTPPLRSDEFLISEIYQVTISAKSTKKGQVLRLALPHHTEDTTLYTLKLLAKRPDQEDWSVVEEATFKSEERLVEFETECGGQFVVVSTTRQEIFEVPVQGCLYNAKIHHQISVRFPKKTCDVPIECHISIIPLNKTMVNSLRNEYQLDMAELLVASDFYEVKAHTDKTFRRSVTVKLPLPPQLQDKEFPKEDLAIMMWTADGWQLYEIPIKFIKNAISFDTRYMTRFCIAQAKPDRKKRLDVAFKHIERENHMERGEVKPFIHIQERLWTLYFDIVPWARVGSTIDKRLQEGFKGIKKQYLPELPVEEEESLIPRRGWRNKSAKPEVEKPPDREDIDLINGGHYEVEVGGDVKIQDDDAGRDNLQLFYHPRLPENFRKYFVEPLPINEGSILTGFLKLYSTDGNRRCLKSFDFDLTPETVAAFQFVEEEPEPEPQPEEEDQDEEELPVMPEPIRVATPAKTPPKPKAPVNNPSFNRLTQPTKAPKKLFKEPRVLTGKSLMTLAREVDQGLTLAIHLDISDSTITGMGFDALANGLSLVDITYKILLLWKRRSNRLKDRQVDMLIEAMEEMGRGDLAELISERNKLNLEITPDCLGTTSGGE